MLRPVRPALALLALAALAAVLALPSCGDDGGGACLGPACGDPGPVVGEYEYIVVGSGAGGGPLASRLARAGHRVLLVEAGQDVGGKLNYRVPARHARATEDPDMAWWYFVRHHDDPTLDAADSKATPEGVLYPRGSALGGSTAVNAMVTVLPARSDWDHLAALTGDPRFRASAMDETVDKVLSWLSVDVPSPALAADDEVVTAMLTAAAAADAQDGADGTDLPALAGELARLLARDLNQTLRAGETTGLYRLPLATRDGERSGPRDLIVDTVAQGYPLTVLTGALVTRVLFDPAEPVPTAIGVELVREEHVYGASLAPAAPSGARQCAFASREVVLSAGTFNTPQLLMLSGIGPQAALDAVGIAPRLVREGVGQNLQDRYEAAVVAELDADIDLVADCDPTAPPELDPCQARWKDPRGVYRTSGFLATVLRRASDDTALADLHVFAVPGDARGYYPGYSADALAEKDRFTWLLLKARSHNRDGTVRLRSASPFERPEIRFSYFDEADPAHDPDLLALIGGVRFIRDILARAGAFLPDDPPREIWPGPDVASDADLGAFIRKETWGHHACCTSPMGRTDDPMAVVDARFRVIGADRLRVVDASVFPEIPGTFIAMPTFMLSEKAAETILEDSP